MASAARHGSRCAAVHKSASRATTSITSIAFEVYPSPKGLGLPEFSQASTVPAAFDGTSPLNSGYVGPNWPAGERYAVTFTAPGQFAYICILHAPAFMLSSVTVTP